MFNNLKQKRNDKREAKRQELECQMKEKEIQAKIRIKRTLGNMKNLSSKMDVFKNEYIDKARNAMLVGNQQNYNLAKQGLKMCLSKQRFLEGMITNFEIAFQMNEMNKVINSFVGGMNEISKELNGITSSIDIAKCQAAYENALARNETQYEAMDAFLKEAEESMGSFNGNADEISDDEIDKLINCQASDTEADIDSEIDSKIESIRAKVNQ